MTLTKKNLEASLENLELHERIIHIVIHEYRNFLKDFKNNSSITQYLLTKDSLEKTLSTFIFETSCHRSLDQCDKEFKKINEKINEKINSELLLFFSDSFKILGHMENKIKTKKELEEFKTKINLLIDSNFEKTFNQTMKGQF